jgi:hypothetical protein
VKPSVLRAAVLNLVLAVGLTACLSSDAPNLSAGDLTAPAALGGAYIATAFPAEQDEHNAMMADVEAIGGRTFRLTFADGERKDAPVLLRLLRLNDGKLLGVVSDPDPAKGAIYTVVTRASNGGWVFRNVEFKPENRDRRLRDALTRHGAAGVDFGTGDPAHDQIKGSLSAANLRALFSDPDFAGALQTERGFRLSPLVSAVSADAEE